MKLLRRTLQFRGLKIVNDAFTQSKPWSLVHCCLFRTHLFKGPDFVTFKNPFFHVRIFGGEGICRFVRASFEDDEAAALISKGGGENPFFFESRLYLSLRCSSLQSEASHYASPRIRLFQVYREDLVINPIYTTLQVNPTALAQDQRP